MLTVDKNSPIILLEDYEISNGDKFIVRKINNNDKPWQIQAFLSDAVGDQDSTVTVKESVIQEPTSEDDFQNVVGLDETSLNEDLTPVILKGDNFSARWIGIKITQNGITSGSVKIILA